MVAAGGANAEPAGGEYGVAFPNEREFGISDGYIAYPLGINGGVVGQGDTYDEALADATAAIQTHLEIFGRDALDDEFPILDAYMVEMEVRL